MVTVAVIIVTWNSSHLIDGVLRSVEAQTLKPTRVLVIDNGSDDSEKLEMIVSRFVDYELLQLDTNMGFAAANNVGVGLCDKIEFIALLNPDAFPESDWLETLVVAAHRYPEAAAFGSRLLDYMNQAKLDGAGDFMTLAGRPGRRGHGGLALNQFVYGEDVFSPCAAAALYRRDALISVGGFDESFFCYIEDIDLSFRLLLAGYRSRYVAESVVLHMGSAVTGRRSEFSIYYGHRNLFWAFVKNMPGILLIALMPLHIALNLFTIVYYICLGQGRVILRSKFDAIKGLPKILRKRQDIQNSRVATAGQIWRLLDKRL